MTYRLTKEHFDKAKQNGISYHTLYQRVHNGWDIDRAMTESVHVKGAIKQNHIYYVRGAK